MLKHMVLLLFCLTIFHKTIYSSALQNDQMSSCYRNGYMFKNGQFSKCIPKCCPEGKYIIGYKRCRSKKLNKDFSEVPVYDKDLKMTGKNLTEMFTLVPGRIMDPDFNDTDLLDYISLGLGNRHRYYITERGILYEEVVNAFNRWQSFNTSQYCIDYLQPMPKRNITKPMLLYFIKTKDRLRVPDDPLLITIGLIISCVFLCLVFLVYALLRELRNLSGMVLMAYVACLLLAFAKMAAIQLTTHSQTVCKQLTFSTYFFFLASFCWMNIMSCDIWWTFRGYAKARPIHRRGEFFKFCVYCIYAFGLPAALTTMVVVINETDMTHLPWFITPKVPLKGCFFAAEEKLLYLYIPMLILILCNWIFFLMTAFNIWRLHRATAVLDSAAAGTPAAHRSQKYRFLVYLKLSVIMGINWVLEVVGSFSPDFKGWYISDAYNMLIGFSIFLIFVWKKKIFSMLVKRFRSCGHWHREHRWYSRSRSSNTTESDVTDVPVCGNPKGSITYFFGDDKTRTA